MGLDFDKNVCCFRKLLENIVQECVDIILEVKSPVVIVTVMRNSWKSPVGMRHHERVNDYWSSHFLDTNTPPGCLHGESERKPSNTNYDHFHTLWRIRRVIMVKSRNLRETGRS